MGTQNINWSLDQTYGLGASGMNVLPTRVAASFLKAKRNRGQLINAMNLNIGSEIVSGPGRVILVPKAQHPAGASASLTDGADTTLDDTTEGSATLTLADLYNETWSLTEVAASISSPVAFDALMAGRMARLMNTIENAAGAYVHAQTSTNSVGTSGVAPSYDTLVGARAKLTDELAPADGDVAGFVDGTTYANLLKDNTIKSAQNQGSVQNLAPAATGGGLGSTVGRPFVWAGGIPWYECQAVSNAAVSTHTERRNFVFHRDAFIFASRAIGSTEFAGLPNAPYIRHLTVDGIMLTLLIAFDPKALAWRMTVMCMSGLIVGREEWSSRVLA